MITSTSSKILKASNFGFFRCTNVGSSAQAHRQIHTHKYTNKYKNYVNNLLQSIFIFVHSKPTYIMLMYFN